jgi:archaellum component FlaC
MIRIIAFTGKRGNGKSTASNKVREVLEGQNLTVVRINFKDGLVSTMREKLRGTLDETAKMYNMTVSQLFDDKPPIMRKLMQEIGTEVYRAIDNDYWVNQWKIMVEGMKDNVVVIVDDVRFQNEFDAVKSLGGTVTRVVATNKEKVVDEHQSEKEQENFATNITITANSQEELELLVVENLTVL